MRRRPSHHVRRVHTKHGRQVRVINRHIARRFRRTRVPGIRMEPTLTQTLHDNLLWMKRQAEQDARQEAAALAKLRAPKPRRAEEESVRIRLHIPEPRKTRTFDEDLVKGEWQQVDVDPTSIQGRPTDDLEQELRALTQERDEIELTELKPLVEAEARKNAGLSHRGQKTAKRKGLHLNWEVR